jgi:CxxC-x17-CxxC domain-containing protein
MGNYSRGGFGGSSGRFGGRSGGFRGGGGFDRDRRPAEMHDVVCDKCGKECQVPFRPTGDKPVLCSDCFRQNGGGSRDRGSSSGISPEQFNQLNTKLDKIIEILESLEVDIEDDDVDESEDDSKDNSKSE